MSTVVLVNQRVCFAVENKQKLQHFFFHAVALMTPSLVLYVHLNVHFPVQPGFLPHCYMMFSEVRLGLNAVYYPFDKLLV